MEKIKLTIQYDGTAFAGSQYQPNERTVQGEIENALKKMHKGEFIRIHGAGRTDAGVHAMAQVFHFETTLIIPSKGWARALRTFLPNDIHIKNVESVASDFHARYHATSKTYRYYVLNQTDYDVFKRHYAYHYPYDLDIAAMQAACKVFEGTHDFTSFSSAKSGVKGSKVRTLTEVSLRKIDNYIEFRIQGDGFLQYMVRIIVGALIEVGRGKRTAKELREILQAKNRQSSGLTVPAHGLYLWEVSYDNLS